MFKNIDINRIELSTELFRLYVADEEIELFRWNRHLLRRPTYNEHRWVTFPLTILLEEGKHYSLKYSVRSTYNMDRSFFMAVGRKTQVFDCKLPKDKWVSEKFEFVSELEGTGSLVITASDLPIGGNYFWIRDLEIDEVN